jgi:hypothetical protein
VKIQHLDMRKKVCVRAHKIGKNSIDKQKRSVLFFLGTPKKEKS